MAKISSEIIAQTFISACEAELQAPKPGNVHIYGDGHGMAVEDFCLSAGAAAPFIAAPQASIGKRILGAMRATWDVVGQNTNLGIVLLCAPLAQAALNVTTPLQLGEDLRGHTGRVLAALDIADAEDAFQAIRLAQPAGLGAAPEHDVAGPAQTTLLEAMRAAQGRDRIGFQYANDFVDIFEIGTLTLARARAADADQATATLLTYLAFLQAFPDSHIARKHGLAAAEWVRQETFKRFDPIAKTGREDLFATAIDWDRTLKKKSLNPGTSADLTVAALFADALVGILAKAAKSD